MFEPASKKPVDATKVIAWSRYLRKGERTALSKSKEGLNQLVIHEKNTEPCSRIHWKEGKAGDGSKTGIISWTGIITGSGGGIESRSRRKAR
jgi:hypothetical protein